MGDWKNLRKPETEEERAFAKKVDTAIMMWMADDSLASVDGVCEACECEFNLGNGGCSETHGCPEEMFKHDTEKDATRGDYPGIRRILARWPASQRMGMIPWSGSFVRERLMPGESVSELAKDLGVSRSSVVRAKRRLLRRTNQ